MPAMGALTRLTLFTMNINVMIRLYEELNSCLSPDRRKRDFILAVASGTPVKELIEKLGIPLSLVDLVLINGKSVDMEQTLNDGDRLSIYPVFETFNISSVTHLREKPLRRLGFICDVHLGKLAKYMRITGLDTLYKNVFPKHQLIQLSIEENRIILTQNKTILKNTLITRGYWVRPADSMLQLKEIIGYFDLKGCLAPLSRCLRCNSTVWPVEKESVRARVPEAVFRMHDRFTKCDHCDRIYWMGSHYASMMEWIRRL
jgi:uncharacterized protein with PIN domain/sulfur carrier protein ThiS